MRMNRRSFLQLSATAAGGGLLAACVAPAPAMDDAGASMAEEPIEIRLAEGSWVGPEGIAFWTDEIIPSFEADHSGIKVTFENAESPDYADKLYTQAVAGDSPDVMFVWDNINYNLLQRDLYTCCQASVKKTEILGRMGLVRAARMGSSGGSRRSTCIEVNYHTVHTHIIPLGQTGAKSLSDRNWCS